MMVTTDTEVCTSNPNITMPHETLHVHYAILLSKLTDLTLPLKLDLRNNCLKVHIFRTCLAPS